MTVVAPVTMTVRIQYDKDDDPSDRLERAIKRAYRDQDNRLEYSHSLTTERDEKNHPEEPGTPYKATVKTDTPLARNHGRAMTVLTRAVEREFDNDIVGARLIIEDADDNGRNFGW